VSETTRSHFRVTVEFPNGDQRSVWVPEDGGDAVDLVTLVDVCQDAPEGLGEELAELKSALSMYFRHPDITVRMSARNELEFVVDEWLKIRGITY
jgi:hypothetical protein